jgi:hypothetical protein
MLLLPEQVAKPSESCYRKFADILIMIKESKTYVSRAVDILRANPNPLIPPAVIGVLFYIPTNSDQKLGPIYFLPMIVLFVIMPLIYGQYIEIISNNRKLPYVQIFNAHWFNFFVVSLCLVIPILIFIMCGLLFGLPVFGLGQILSIVIDILSIYILPLVFLLRKRFSCIPLGIKCLVGNFKFSRPLIFLAMVPTILHLLTIPPADNTAASLPFLFLNYLFFVFSLIIDLVIFIAAGLILKEKLLQT